MGSPCLELIGLACNSQSKCHLLQQNSCKQDESHVFNYASCILRLFFADGRFPMSMDVGQLQESVELQVGI